ncbi:hypothetical protein [Nitrosomonas communis]|uniref:Uncharacterized protein n=1 Tax=Nitrosomonas communis TaxID=44574 RepID=A0A1H2YYE5_9PROT|nr:hypothetical protein [Nitrosomonas communis]SDX10091.1 hypothetical protein SAMN05421882_10613 [Nitrosomonas communis]
MKTRTNINMRVKFLSVMLLSVALAAPMTAEAKKGHRHHHRHHAHHAHHHHHGHQSHHHRHTHYNHYNTQNIYYNQPYPPAPAYGIAAGRYFLGVNTGNVGFVLSGY